MKHLTAAALAVAMVLPVAVPAPAEATIIQRACLASDRGAGNRTLCRCIQSAADATLTRRDQRLGATFFEEPGAAQEIRQSDRRGHEIFWERWRTFGERATEMCS